MRDNFPNINKIAFKTTLLKFLLCRQRLKFFEIREDKKLIVLFRKYCLKLDTNKAKIIVVKMLCNSSKCTGAFKTT